MTIEIRRIQSYLKGLAEVRARVDADVQRLQKIHDEITAKLAAAMVERDSCDCLIRKYDQRLETRTRSSRSAPGKAAMARVGHFSVPGD